MAPGFTARETRLLASLRTPAGVQRALDAMPYHLASTAWSPRRVLAERTAHCLEGAIFAAAALRLRSEEHTSELQSLAYLVCRLLLEKKKNLCHDLKLRCAAA